MTLTAQPRVQHLSTVARRLVGGPRGILAADESIGTMSARLAAEGIVATPDSRRDYRQLLLTAPGLATHVSGIILCEETFGQRLRDGRAFPVAARELGVLPGIKVDTGTARLPGSDCLVTEGLDGLGERLQRFADEGAAFAKWRAVLAVDTLTPWAARANAHALARYAALCQQVGIVPVVEPEVLCAGQHDLVDCAAATRLALESLFEELALAEVDLSAVVLKPNFVTPGLGSQSVSPRTVATVTLDVLREAVPAAVPGIAFLSGGHRREDVCDFLAALNDRGTLPWSATFSFGRALVNDALATWGGSPANVTRAQATLIASCTRAAAATRRR